MANAVSAYAADVAAGTFPGSDNSSSMDAAVLEEVLGAGALDRAQMSDEPIPLDRDL
jgi:hypothetical protein